MTTPKKFADVELALLRWAAAGFATEGLPQSNLGTERPLNLQELIAPEGNWFFRVERIGGRDDGVTDRAIVDVEVFALTRAVAYTRAEDVRARLLQSPHRVDGPRVVILDDVFTERAPTRLPAEDENLNRYTATYRISARR